MGSRIGWCVYQHTFKTQAHIDAINLHKPPVIRWFLEINRFVNNNNPTTTDWASAYGAAFDAVADAETTLVVQLQMSNMNWTSSDSGGTLGCSGWRQGGTGSSTSWLASTAADSPWAIFFAGLRSAIDAAGVNVHYGLWNEPDWRNDAPWSVYHIPDTNNGLAPTVPWSQAQFLPYWPSPPFGWSGGFQKMADMRALYPELSWTSDGVGIHHNAYAFWGELIGPDTTIDIVDIHVYRDTLQNTLDYIAIVEDYFSSVGRTNLPIVIGELGDNANGSTCSEEWFGRTLDLVEAIDDLYPGRLIGICAHMDGTRSINGVSTTFPPLWQDDILVNLESAFGNDYDDNGGGSMAAGDIKLAYSSATDLLTSGSLDAIRSGGSTLTAGQFSTSAVIDNSTTLYQDIQLYVQIYTNSASATGPVHLYIAATVAGTDEFEDTLTANQTAAAATGWIANAHHVASLYANTQTGYYASGVVNIAGKFGGRAPRKMLLVVRNETTQTIPASTNHQIEWRGVYSTVAAS